LGSLVRGKPLLQGLLHDVAPPVPEEPLVVVPVVDVAPPVPDDVLLVEVAVVELVPVPPVPDELLVVVPVVEPDDVVELVPPVPPPWDELQPPARKHAQVTATGIQGPRIAVQAYGMRGLVAPVPALIHAPTPAPPPAAALIRLRAPAWR
jgi:hypothetical protein